MNRIQVIAKNTDKEQYSSSAPPAATAPCEKAVHRASHFPVGAKKCRSQVLFFRKKTFNKLFSIKSLKNGTFRGKMSFEHKLLIFNISV